MGASITDPTDKSFDIILSEQQTKNKNIFFGYDGTLKNLFNRDSHKLVVLMFIFTLPCVCKELLFESLANISLA